MSSRTEENTNDKCYDPHKPRIYRKAEPNSVENNPPAETPTLNLAAPPYALSHGFPAFAPKRLFFCVSSPWMGTYCHVIYRPSHNTILQSSPSPLHFISMPLWAYGMFYPELPYQRQIRVMPCDTSTVRTILPWCFGSDAAPELSSSRPRILCCQWTEEHRNTDILPIRWGRRGVHLASNKSHINASAR